MRVLLAGGSGQVGTVLARHFASRGHGVTVLTRTPRSGNHDSGAPWQQVGWDARTLGPWVDAAGACDVWINLAGRSVNCRYGKRNRRAIMDSRVNSTRVLHEAWAKVAPKPRVWLNASTATIYRHALGPDVHGSPERRPGGDPDRQAGRDPDRAMDERTGELGGEEPGVPETWRFSILVAKRWEEAFFTGETPGTRRVALRSAMTMSPDRGGVFDVLLGLVRRWLGGSMGPGTQYVSWIHDADFCAAVEFLIEREDLSGPVNLAAPGPLPNREFMRVLRQAWGTRWGLPATRPMLAFGTWVLRTETELVLKSRRVVPGLLGEAGFTFQFPEWPDAARDLVRRWRAESGERPRAAR